MITRIIAIADSHFSERSRFDECIRIHDWIAYDVRRRAEEDGVRVAAILHAGDVFHARSTERERLEVAGWLELMSRIAPMVVVRGNHDRVGELPLVPMLRTENEIYIVETWGMIEIHIEGHAPLRIAAVAWPRTAELRAAFPTGDLNGPASASMRALLAGLRDELERTEGPRVLLTHAMVRGSRTGTGQPLVGCDLEIGVEDLAVSGADIAVLGHIHQHQSWGAMDGESFLAVYPGSPRRTDFGEMEKKGYLEIDFDSSVCGCSHRWARGKCSLCLNRGDVRWTLVETPATPMVAIDCEIVQTDEPVPRLAWKGGVDGMLPLDERFIDVSGAEVRFRYNVAAEHRGVCKPLVEQTKEDLLARGAVDVALDPVTITVSHARVPEIATETTISGKLERMWESQGRVPETDTKARLLSKLGKLEDRS